MHNCVEQKYHALLFKIFKFSLHRNGLVNEIILKYLKFIANHEDSCEFLVCCKKKCHYFLVNAIWICKKIRRHVHTHKFNKFIDIEKNGGINTTYQKCTFCTLIAELDTIEH